MENIVIFSGIQFLFRFLPIFLTVYYLTPAKHRNAVLFSGSVIFYACGQPKALILLLALTVINYYLGNEIYFSGKKEAAALAQGAEEFLESPLDEEAGGLSGKLSDKQKFLIAAVSVDAAALIVCKILALAVNASLLPLGMSFYIFKMISYQADIYNGVIRKRPSFVRTAAYFTMFPQVTQGPIMKYSDGFSGKKLSRVIDFERFEDGLVYVVMGLGMKVVLADRIGILWNEINKIGYESISTPLAWLGAYGYTFQLFYDFWGYSLIAAGVGMMLGFDFILNFDHPYSADSIADFYRRWHATLGAWFRDYIYIPLGGSRHGTLRTIRNLMIVWAVTGLWHGGTVNFLIWGLVLGLIIVFEKYVLKKTPEKAEKIVGKINVLVIIPLTWVIFAISGLSDLGMYFARLFPFFGMGKTADTGDFMRFFGIYWPYFAASALLCVPAVFNKIYERRKNPIVIAFLAVLFWVSVYYMVTASGNKFMYFSF